MKLEKWGDELVIPVPDDVAQSLGLKPGDNVTVTAESIAQENPVTPEERAAAIRAIRELARPLPPGWKFDREEANSR